MPRYRAAERNMNARQFQLLGGTREGSVHAKTLSCHSIFPGVR